MFGGPNQNNKKEEGLSFYNPKSLGSKVDVTLNKKDSAASFVSVYKEGDPYVERIPDDDS